MCFFLLGTLRPGNAYVSNMCFLRDIIILHRRICFLLSSETRTCLQLEISFLIGHAYRFPMTTLASMETRMCKICVFLCFQHDQFSDFFGKSYNCSRCLLSCSVAEQTKQPKGNSRSPVLGELTCACMDQH